MTSPVRNLGSDPLRPSFLEELYQGRFRWDLIRQFPVQEAVDRQAGERAVGQTQTRLRGRVDPELVAATRRLPEELLTDLYEAGYTRLQAPVADGGWGLSHLNLFRVIEELATTCFPLAVVVAIDNSLGVSAFREVVPAGPLRDLIRGHLAGGGFTAPADTEPGGAGNQLRGTTAVPTADGYLLNGAKIHVGNATIAGMFAVTATIEEDGVARNRLFFVPAGTAGLSRAQEAHEFMGLAGLPNGWVRLDNVRVPRWAMLREPDPVHQSRLTPKVSMLIVRGRLFMIAAPSLAAARLAAKWAGEFAGRRRIDGQGLATYQEIQRQLAESLADTYAVESVVHYALLGEERDLNLRPEQNAAKNISSVIAWRVVERTMSLCAGEGYESARSKARRQAVPQPLERLYRDLRGMRISGGVDFQIDSWTGSRSILSYYYPEPEHAAQLARGDDDFDWDDPRLSVANRSHLRFLCRQVPWFGRTCLALARRYPQRAELASQQRTMILLSQLANELLTMALVLARVASVAPVIATVGGDSGAQDLAEVYAAGARYRVADLRHQLAEQAEPPYRRVCARWLGDPDPVPAHAGEEVRQ